MIDTAGLSGDQLAEFERDRQESNRRYDESFEVVLSHTSAVELEEFWTLFGSSKPEAPLESKAAAFEFSNPILAEPGVPCGGLNAPEEQAI